jgi:NitT/TauT family transport system ATP-binding protein
MSVELNAQGVTLEYARDDNKTVALADCSLRITESEFITLVGPSGCGKSSFLNMVAGFLQPTRGSLLLDGTSIKGPGADRGVVFQEHALFPWMTVERNIAYGPRVNGVAEAEIARIVSESLEMIGLQRFARAYPKELSGGMKQRVAIARALATRPKMLLMDEPFAALDAQTRRFLQGELVRIWKLTGTTILFITHSIDEAILLSDRVVVLTPRPGTVGLIVDIDLPRPRTPNVRYDPRFVELSQQLREAIYRQLYDGAAASVTGEPEPPSQVRA